MESKIHQKITAGILTISDKGSRGEREDLSGIEIRKLLETLPAEVLHYEIIPDETDIIAERLMHLADSKHLDLILTTGGTGVSPRDVTPEATLRVIEKEIPGLAELMRLKSLEITPHAALSRAVAGIRCPLIGNLPGAQSSGETAQYSPHLPPAGLDQGRPVGLRTTINIYETQPARIQRHDYPVRAFIQDNMRLGPSRDGASGNRRALESAAAGVGTRRH